MDRPAVDGVRMGVTVAVLKLQINRWGLSFGADFQQSLDHSSQTYLLPERQGFVSRLREVVASGYVGLQGVICSGLSMSTTIKEQYFKHRLATVNNTRSLLLSFAWRFNGFKPKGESTQPDTSRFGTK